MTPRELHAIYAPAWEAAPEARPSHQGQPLTIFRGRNTKFTACGWGGSYEGIYAVDTTSAAALCRCAAEDWLLDNVFSALEITKEQDGSLVIRTGSDHADWLGSGPTIHHALAAAVVAVAGGKR